MVTELLELNRFIMIRNNLRDYSGMILTENHED